MKLKKLLCTIFGHKWGDFHLVSRDGNCKLYEAVCPRCNEARYIGTLESIHMPKGITSEQIEAKLI